MLRAIGQMVRLLDDLCWLFRKGKLVVVTWCKYDGTTVVHNNWGDDINVFFLEKISGLKVKAKNLSYVYQKLPLKAYSCIGSIIGISKVRNVEIWGSGLISDDSNLQVMPQKIHSVRGALTRQELLRRGIECPAIYGDPALLISRYFRPSFEKRYNVGIIPHYKDEDNIVLKSFLNKHPEILVIRMRDYEDWLDIPRQICSCRRIISSSLHGLIMADSYRVPNVWVRFSDEIIGGNFKYLDYFSSVGRDEIAPYVIKGEADIEKIISRNNFSLAQNNRIDYKRIFAVCPFKEKLTDYRDVMPQLSAYGSFGEKEMQYCTNEYIDTESELDSLILKLQLFEHDLIFRGVGEASYKMFASSQRHYVQKSDWVARMGHDGYYGFVEEVIRRTECLPEVQQYMQQTNVHTNDMFLMALMQHFGAPSPMIDFSENLLTGLFFASDWDENNWIDSGNNEIGDYVSVYYISKHFDWVQATVQQVMQNNINRMIADASRTYTAGDAMSKSGNETEENIRHLLYRQFRLDGGQSDITFIPVGGPDLSRVNVSIPSLGFECDYEIINDKIVKQQGMFIMNNTENEPLVEVMNKQAKQKIFCCVNIHKKLLPYLRERYLIPANITHDIMYEKGNPNVGDMLAAIRSLS